MLGGTRDRAVVTRIGESALTSGMTCAELGRFRHEAVFYDGAGDLVPSILPFIREGVDRGEPVLVALLPDRLDRVEAALGPDATRVDFVDMGELGANPACIIPEWRRFLEDTREEGPVRGVGEPVWSGRRDEEIDEAVLHEALLNLAFEHGPGWQLVCPYDTSVLPQHVIGEAVRSHPVAVRAAEHPAVYAGPADAVERFARPLPLPPADTDAWDFGPHDLAGLRTLAAGTARAAGVTRARVDDLVLAAHELATNSVLHGGGAGVLRVWTEPGAFVLEITDSGRIADPLVGRTLLGEMAESGRGIWMANQLCDLVQVRSGDQGTAVRLFSWL